MRLVAALVVVLLAAGAWMLRGERVPARTTETAATSGDVAVASASVPAHVDARLPRPNGVQPSQDALRDTDVDGAVTLGSDGRPVADFALRRLFDYQLTRLGAVALRDIRARFEAWLAQNYGAAVVADVMRLFDAYVDVQQRSAALSRSGDLRRDLAALKELRERLLGAALADAWFGEEHRYAELTLERLAIANDAALDADDRARRLAALAGQADAAQIAAMHEATDHALAVEQSAQLDADAIDDATRFRERSALWGEPAAERLADLDREHAQWQQRYAAFVRERAAILADTSINAIVRDERIAALLRARFGEPEQRRVLALLEQESAR